MQNWNRNSNLFYSKLMLSSLYHSISGTSWLWEHEYTTVIFRFQWGTSVRGTAAENPVYFSELTEFSYVASSWVCLAGRWPYTASFRVQDPPSHGSVYLLVWGRFLGALGQAYKLCTSFTLKFHSHSCDGAWKCTVTASPRGKEIRFPDSLTVLAACFSTWTCFPFSIPINKSS